MEHVAAAPAHGQEDHASAFERARLAMWLFLSSEIMMFGAFIAAYVVLWMAAPTVIDDKPETWAFNKHHLSWKIALFNTAVLILSSYTMVRAVNAIAKNDRAHCEDMIVATATLGLLFLCVKGYEYSLKFADGIG